MPGDEILSAAEVEARPKVALTFADLGRTVEACVGESVLQAALRHGIHIEHACGGFCACSTCHVIVDEGMANLSEKQDDEEDRLDTAVGLDSPLPPVVPMRTSGRPREAPHRPPPLSLGHLGYDPIFPSPVEWAPGGNR